MNTLTKTLTSRSLATGLAMFSMFFGAGNIIFPLALGRLAGNQNGYAISGLLLTAAAIPIAGVISILLFDGSYRSFFQRIGKIPGFVLALIIISLLGPLGSCPRCIALSYTTLKNTLPMLSQTAFSGLSCIVIFLFTFKRNKILSLLGWILTPALLASLITIIILGLTRNSSMPAAQGSPVFFFLEGLKEGYNTMDLLAAFFFSSGIVTGLKMQSSLKASPLNTAFRASLIAALLLSIIYIGFSYLTALHGNLFIGLGKDELLAAVTMKIAGAYAGPLVCSTVALACLTTAIALISAFTDFVHKEVFQEKLQYNLVLISSLLITFFVSTFEFTKISAFLGPILEICYPGLIVLTALNILHKITGFTPIKIPVFLTFLLSAYFYYTN